MDGLYAESRAKKKVTVKDHLIKVGLIAGMVIFFGLGFISFNAVLLIIGIAFLGLGYYFLPRLATEYEYVFCDGQVDFDKINGGLKRKTMLRVDFEKLVVIAPKNSHALDGYRHNGVEVKDFSSMEADAKVYGMVVTGGERQTLIYFEPNEKMLAVMKQKAPRKIMEC
ncbi:MAG: hypothetical protein J6J42_00250 [Lachnospiraceae bacterium]|nr:hypothetical protein [Lachnospiraceae bacterium]MBP3608746.1 hypothetical protein [Lachnospiraceae bacterium]